MRKKLLSFFIIMLILVLGACGASDETEELTPLEVDLQVPETADVGETIPLKATVGFGDKKVDDADDVEFEVWEDGEKEDTLSMDDDSTDKFDADNDGDGVYSGEISFDKDGVFVVQVHVTAEGLHTMPLQKVTVGEGASEEDAAEDDQKDEKDEKDDEEEGK